MDHTPGFWCLCTGGLGLPSGPHLSIPCFSPEPLPTRGYFQKPGQPGLIIQRQGRKEEEGRRKRQQPKKAGDRVEVVGEGRFLDRWRKVERVRMCEGSDEGRGKVRDSTRGQADQTEAGQMDGKERIRKPPGESCQ